LWQLENDSDKMAAGGPGAGRHKGEGAPGSSYDNTFKRHGWSYSGKNRENDHYYTHPEYGQIRIPADGGFHHGEASGEDLRDLKEHLWQLENDSDKMAADYHDNPGRSMPSVAHGLSARSR